MPAAYCSPDARYWQANTRAFFILPVTKVEWIMAAKAEMRHELYNAEVRNDTQIPELKGSVLGERFDPPAVAWSNRVAIDIERLRRWTVTNTAMTQLNSLVTPYSMIYSVSK